MICIVICIEFFLRLIKLPHLSYEGWLPPIYQYHEEKGFNLIPNSGGFYKRYYEWNTKIKINSNGWNDYEYPLVKKAGTFRIACIGDSFTLNIEVPIEKNYPKTLERLLKQQVSNNIEVLNFSLDGTGPEAHYIMFRDYALKYQPDMVIHNFHSNDIRDVQMGKYYRQSYKNMVIQYQLPEELERGKAKVDKLFSRRLGFSKHGILKYSYLSRLLLKLRGGKWPNDYMIFAHSYEPKSTYKDAVEKTKNITMEFKELADKHQVSYLKVFLYDKEALYYDEGPTLKKLRDFLITQNIPYFDTHEAFKQAHHKQKLYWKYDTHLTEEGCRLIAESVSNFLQQKRFIGG
jgi:lysophospholipase L1-like esterase